MATALLAGVEAPAHGGVGLVAVSRVLDRTDRAGSALRFIDVAVLKPGTSIGFHRHAADEEEFYLVLEGEGSMRREADVFRVGAGDLVRNPPGGAHGLVNDGTTDLRLFVFEVRA